MGLGKFTKKLSEQFSPKGNTQQEKVQDQVQRQAGVGGTAAETGTAASTDAPAEAPKISSGSMLTEPILVVNQKAKLFETAAEHEVFDQHGNLIGYVAEVGQSSLKVAARFVSRLDQFMTHQFEVRDANQQPILVLKRPRKFMKSKFEITKPDGSAFGDVKQKNVIGKIRFELEAGGQVYGTIKAENWRQWNFHVIDTNDKEVAKITKTLAGLGVEIFTTADNYVIEIDESVPEPLRSLIVISSLCIDTALKQDSGGILS